MRHPSLVIFDGDDTLWNVESLYDAALDRSEQLIERAGLSGRDWRRKQRAIDLEKVEKLGMSPERFPQSSVDALEAIAGNHGRSISSALRDAVREASASVFASTAQVVEGAADVLKDLRPHFCRALLTKGDRQVQEKRIADSGLKDCFDRIEIVERKDERSFADIAGALTYRPQQCWSVGNSIASDINPALRLGMHAIWIDAHVWEHERREAILQGEDVTVLHNLRDVPDALLARSAQSA